MSVEHNGKYYRAKKKGMGESSRLTLNLSGKGITNISEIIGLETLTNLHVLKLNDNSIGEIKGLETLNNLIQLELRGNQITKINGLENLINLEELTLESNKIKSIRGLDTLKNLHTLNLFVNKITEVESFQNKENLSRFHFSRNPLYNQVQEIFGTANYQNLIKFSQMSVSEIHSRERVIREKNRARRVEQGTLEKKRKSSYAGWQCFCELIGGGNTTYSLFPYRNYLETKNYPK